MSHAFVDPAHALRVCLALLGLGLACSPSNEGNGDGGDEDAGRNPATRVVLDAHGSALSQFSGALCTRLR